MLPVLPNFLNILKLLFSYNNFPLQAFSPKGPPHTCFPTLCNVPQLASSPPYPFCAFEVVEVELISSD